MAESQAALSVGRFRLLVALRPEEAAAEYLRRAGPIAFRAVRKHRLPVDLAEDLVQDGFKVVRSDGSLGCVRSGTSLDAWIAGLLGHLARHRHERDIRERRALGVLASMARELRAGPLEGAEDLLRVRRLTLESGLPPRQRYVVLLSSYGTEMDEIARLARTKRQAVESYLERGVETLRSLVAGRPDGIPRVSGFCLPADRPSRGTES